MATLQVKGMDDRLYNALKVRARMEKRSLSREVVKIIEEALSAPPRSPADAARAFLALAGTWRDERPAREIVADIRAARRTGSRSRRLRGVFD